MADETLELARFAANLTYGQIPNQVSARALDLLVDQIGCEIGCSGLPWAQAVRETYRKPGGTPEATVIRHGDRLPVGSAAIINSTFGQSFEYDDVNTVCAGHPGAELIPPLMAIAERGHVSGSDFLLAFIAAYEVRGRIGWALSPSMIEHGGPQYSTACGPFGVAAGVARLLRLGDEGICNALGIAGAFSGGLMQYDHGGGSVKRMYTGIAASSGIQAAHLAQAGITGPEGILEGTRGLLRIYSRVYRPERLIHGFGKKWIIEDALFKPYSCCAPIHPAIDALSTLMNANNLNADDIESILVHYPKRSIDHVAITSPHDLLGMQFSTSYSLALTALKGGNTPREYTMQALADPQVLAFASRVHLREDAELTKLYPLNFPARVTVRTTSRQVYEELVINAKGSAGARFSSAEVDAKFRSQVGDVLGAECCDKLIRVIRNIIVLGDIAQLPPMLVLDT